MSNHWVYSLDQTSNMVLILSHDTLTCFTLNGLFVEVTSTNMASWGENVSEGTWSRNRSPKHQGTPLKRIQHFTERSHHSRRQQCLGATQDHFIMHKSYMAPKHRHIPLWRDSLINPFPMEFVGVLVTHSLIWDTPIPSRWILQYPLTLQPFPGKRVLGILLWLMLEAWSIE